MLRVFKADGEYRWIAVSSSAFKDRSGETVSPESVDYSLKVAKGDYGELRLYHLPGSRVGTCDGSMRVGMFLVESGIFDKTETAVLVRSTIEEHPEKYGVSIGFRYRPTDLIKGRYKRIRIFERSIVEEPDAAALFTNIRLMEDSAEVMPMSERNEELVAKLADMLGGNEELAANFVSKASEIGIKMQAGEDVAFKNEDEDEETSTEPTPEPEVQKTVEETPGSEEEAEKTQNFLLELDTPTVEALASEIAKRMPVPEQDAIKMVDARLTSLEEQLKTQLDTVGELLGHLLKSDEEKVKDIQKQLPRMRLTAFRPSDAGETVTEAPEVAEKEILPLPETLAASLDAIHRYRQEHGIN